MADELTPVRCLMLIVDNLQRRPGMYLEGDMSYATVVSFLHGYSCAEAVHGLEPTLEGFRQFVASRPVVGTNLGWSGLVLQQIAGGDEERALEELFHLLREYLIQKVQ